MRMQRLVPAMLFMLLTGCGSLQGSPQPAPPVTSQPQEIQRNQTQELTRMGTVSVLERGSPDDSERALRAKAVAAQADYYQILLIDETVVPGQWYGQAILFKKPR
ncbi:biofilm peroxide resistance protein BsmA [Atlantibacter hermannii]|uniref:biofilm peroxide resistance protein BsmA n=1 Tax=Atlantibacter hermannii TaxID=565 RepID=UPI0028AEA844|nr:biofilm peroxide resistance protein BsmA [Atlantibacter hermannii]